MAKTLAALVVATLGLPATALAQNHSSPSTMEKGGVHRPARVETVLDNESVTVVRIRMAPHEKTPMHDIPTARVVIWLTDANLKETLPGGAVRNDKVRAGDVEWVPVTRHQGENLGDDPIEFVAVIPKHSAQ